MTDFGDCPLCGRKLVIGSSVNQHHLVPRSRNGKETVALHRICHAAIHAALSEKELERQYNTIEKLRNHPQLSRFVTGFAASRRNFGYALVGHGDIAIACDYSSANAPGMDGEKQALFIARPRSCLTWRDIFRLPDAPDCSWSERSGRSTPTSRRSCRP